MDRRAAVKRISTILGVAISAPTMAGIMSGCQANTSGALKSLSGSQHELLGVMTELIIPETDTPGAKAAGVADYIDAMLTDFYSDENKARFLSGIAETEAKAQEMYSKDFLACTTDEQYALLNGMDAEAFPDMDAMDEAAKEAFQQKRRADGKPFIATLKELTVAGFYTSEVGATQELSVNPMGSYRGDVSFDEIGRAWA
ncbi:MAG: gluconate 2-dehydrogenase subunit 3 family protein [Rhodothermales bacterium]